MEWLGSRTNRIGAALACLLLAAACSPASGGGTMDSGEDTPGDSGPRRVEVSGDLVEPGDMPDLPDLAADAAEAEVGEVDAAVDTKEIIPQPLMVLEPPDQITFGLAAQGLTVKREFSIQNLGNLPLTIELLEISENTDDNEFAIVEDEQFGPTLGGGEPGVLSPMDKVELVMTFTNKGTYTGSAAGKLQIGSDDLQVPDAYLDLLAQRTGPPLCKLSLVPSKLEFGSVPHGANMDKTIFLKNSGNACCTFTSATVTDCFSMWGTSPQCSDWADPSELFKPVSVPSNVTDGLAPGTAHPIQIKFTPPSSSSTPWGNFEETYYGVLQVTYSEEYTSPGEWTEHTVPEQSNSGMVFWNVKGSSGIGTIECVPNQLNAGVVQVGCSSPPTCLKTYNAGTAALLVHDVYVEGCENSEFQLDSYPELPAEIHASQHAEICLSYKPEDEGPDTCYLAIASSDLAAPLYKIKLTGEGTSGTELSDEFPQILEGRADILFVIDESPSMYDSALKMKEAFDKLASDGEQWTGDLQIGITVNDIADPDGDAGELQGIPRFHTVDTLAEFADEMPGLTAAPAMGQQEAGLEAARRALTPPLINDSDVPCGCAEEQPCPANCDQGDLCIGGKCRGYNHGFLRPDASLQVVFFADEEDKSSGSIPFYIDLFKSIKGIYNVDLFHAFAIVGDFNGGCPFSEFEFADAGKRYIEAQEATGGNFTSVCMVADYADALKDIWLAAQSATREQFLLAGIPEAQGEDMTVSVLSGQSSTPCSTGWQYDADSNSVIVTDNGPCSPEPGESLKVEYTLACF